MCCAVLPSRGNKPFARTPIHMQPLSLVPPGSVPASAAGAAAAPEPAPLSWTPMRTYSSMQPRAGAALSLKRGRTDGSPLGTPLLGAGLAADSDRRIRRRGEQVCLLPISMLSASELASAHPYSATL